MAEQTNNMDYPFKDAPLTPAVFEYLVSELFQGKLVERQVLEDEVVRAHVSRGGKKPQAGTATRPSKKALTNMKEKGLAENPVVGHWRFPVNDQQSTSPLSVSIDSSQIPTEDEEEFTEQQDLPEPVADQILGSGPAAVYLYYLPVYRLRAEEHGEKLWPCKIGRTDRDPVSRVLAQAATALPERPHIALIIRTSFSLAWESALHGVLTLRGRRIEDSPGSEWFLTSPEEVYKLAILFDPTFAHSQDATAPSEQVVA